jgi:hypothetical protein
MFLICNIHHRTFVINNFLSNSHPVISNNKIIRTVEQAGALSSFTLSRLVPESALKQTCSGILVQPYASLPELHEQELMQEGRGASW